MTPAIAVSPRASSASAIRARTSGGLSWSTLAVPRQAAIAISKPVIALVSPSKRPSLILSRVQAGFGASRASCAADMSSSRRTKASRSSGRTFPSSSTAT
jgi:hypothetical protein